MSSFTKDLIVEVLDSGRKFRLVESFSYYRKDDISNIITIPKGFITDFATTPRILWSVLPPFGRYAKACVLHDFLCENAKIGNISRKYADSVFKEALKVSKVHFFTRNVLYIGVRIYAILKGYK